MTLTSSPTAPSDIHRSFRILKERIRRRWKFEYLAVCERNVSGAKHLHIVFKGNYIPAGWLSAAWASIHGSSIVDVRQVAKTRGTARYLAKYVGKEIDGRWWASWGWIYRGWRVIHHGVFANLPGSRYLKTFISRCDAWTDHLKGRTLWLNACWIPPPRLAALYCANMPRDYGKSLTEAFGLIVGYARA
jgi:hypothetical protein